MEPSSIGQLLPSGAGSEVECQCTSGGRSCAASQSLARGTKGHCLLLRFHELTYQGRNVIGSGIEREVSCVEHVNVGIGYILAVTFWLTQIERKIVLAPDDQELWLRLLHPCLPSWIGVDVG